jgi:dUTP pyrophosphatase
MDKMLKVILDGKTKSYYKKGDKVVDLSTDEIYEIEKIDTVSKKIHTTNGYILDLTPDIRPIKETVDNAKIIDKRVKVNKIDEILFAKVRPDAKIPTKIDENGCYDLYACFDEERMTIKPHEIVLIPTGIASAFDKKFRIDVRERGSSGTKGLARRAGQIDSGFRGEWFVCINNTSNNTIVITKQDLNSFYKAPNTTYYSYDKAIAQFAVEFVPRVTTKEVSYDELKEIKSERGMGMLGSSRK